VGLAAATVLRYLLGNVVLYIAWAFLWGVPAVAGLGDLGENDGPPLLYAAVIVLIALIFFSFFLLLQLLVYLSVLYRLRRRRMLAVLLSPLAVGLLFVFAQGPLAALIVIVAGASYGLSVWFPQGPPAWWQTNRRLVPLALGAWLVATVGVAYVQTFPAGTGLDAAATIRDGTRTARYRLACEYDRSGRVRAAAAANTHPGGETACRLLDEALELRPNGDFQDGCPADARSGEFRGRREGRTFSARVVAAECQETAFVDGEVRVLVPPV
jgi:hypothetical protein